MGEKMSEPESPPEPATPKQVPKQVDESHVAKGVGTTLVARMGAVIDVISQPVYVAMFGLASFGLYAVLWATINLIENFLDLGMTSAMQRTVPQAKSEGEATELLRASLILGVGPCALAALAICLYPGLITGWVQVAPEDQHLVEPAVQMFIWALPLWAFVEIATSALRARHLFGPEIRLRIVWEQIIRFALAVLFYFIGWGLFGLFLAHMLSLSITTILSLRLVARHFDMQAMWRRPLITPMFIETAQAGLAILPANAVARLFGDAPAVALNAMLPGAAGATASALFVIARKISSLVQMLRTAFAYVLAPLASAATRGDDGNVERLYAYVTRVLFALAPPMSVGLIAATPSILRFFGPEAAVAAPAVALLILGRMVDALAGAATPVMQVTRSYRSQLIASIAGFLVAAAMVMALLPDAGLVGMCAAVAVGISIASIIPVVQLWISGLHPFGPPFMRVLGVSVAAAAVGFALGEAAYALPLVAQLPVQLVVLLGAVWVSCRYGLPASDRASLGKMGKILRLIPKGV